MMKDGRTESALFKPFVIYYKPATFPMKHFTRVRDLFAKT